MRAAHSIGTPFSLYFVILLRSLAHHLVSLGNKLSDLSYLFLSIGGDGVNIASVLPLCGLFIITESIVFVSSVKL